MPNELLGKIMGWFSKDKPKKPVDYSGYQTWMGGPSSMSPTYHGPSLTDPMYSAAMGTMPSYIPTPTDPELAKKAEEKALRNEKIADFDRLIKFYKELKSVSTPETVLEPLEATMKRLTAEIYYL